MKKSLISASVASIMAFLSFSANATGPTVYGRIDVAATSTDNTATLQTGTPGVNINEMNHSGIFFENNLSNLGVKGNENLAEGYNVFYQVEFGINNLAANSDTRDLITARNSYLGLKTRLGSFLVGRNDTVFKQSKGNIDAFGNTNADMDRLISGQTRAGDGIWYYSPKIANLVGLNLTYLMRDNNNPPSTNTRTKKVYKAAISATIGDMNFKEHSYFVAAAYNRNIGAVDAYRITGQMKLNSLKLGALLEKSKSTNEAYKGLDGNTYYVSVIYGLGNGFNVKAQYGHDSSGLGKFAQENFKHAFSAATDLAKVDDIKVNQMAFGADYRLSKSTMVYGQYAHYQGDFKLSGAKVDFTDENVFSLGMRYDF